MAAKNKKTGGSNDQPWNKGDWNKGGWQKKAGTDQIPLNLETTEKSDFISNKKKGKLEIPNSAD